MSVTIHTSIGDLKLEIFCDTAPRTAFNFLALAASGSYDGTTFHRNIKGFMIQAGDTAEKTGTKGGESIWGAVAFPDEFHASNKHDKRGVLSMANKGKNTNRSQFFLCYERQPHLDNLHTVFGTSKAGLFFLKQLSYRSLRPHTIMQGNSLMGGRYSTRWRTYKSSGLLLQRKSCAYYLDDGILRTTLVQLFLESTNQHFVVPTVSTDRSIRP
jgi:peptidyl-prolyl cis-trans isomerase-like 3